MPKLKIEIELSDHLHRAYRCEAERKGEPLEKLVERVVNQLLREMEREVNEGPVFLC